MRYVFFLILLLSGCAVQQPAEIGRIFRDCPNCPEMVEVPAGSFMMGSPEDEMGRDINEGPQHRVTIAKPFAVGRFEVTVDQWGQCVAADGCFEIRWKGKGWGRGEHPVVNLSWENAQDYVTWLSGRTGKRYRLLTEAEWEYVARAGTTTPFSTGATIGTDQANYNGNHTYGNGQKGTYMGLTVSVGIYPANRFGIHELHGNVSEWVEDCWHENYSGAPADGSAWITGGVCVLRVFRGGSWNYSPENLRSSARGWGRADNYPVYAWYGFRVARTLD